MWHSLMDTEITLGEKVLRTIGVYILLLILIRVTGRRSLAGMNSMDLVVMFLLSNVVQNAIIGDDTSWWGGAVGAVTLVAVNTIINRLAMRYDRLNWLFVGPSVQVIKNGHFETKTLRRYLVRSDEINHAVHLQSGDSVNDIKDGELSPTGQLILTLTKSAQAATHGDIERILDRLQALENRLTART